MPLFTIGGYGVELAGVAEGAPDTITESVAQGGMPRAVVRLMTSWAGRYSVFAGMLGSASGGPGSIFRLPPMAYPPSPNLYCLAIPDAKPLKHKGDWNFEKCIFTAEFGIPTYDIPGSPLGVTDPSGLPWTTTRTRVSAEVVQVPIGSYLYTAGTDSGKAVPEANIGLTIPHSEITVTRHLMPYVPYSEAMTYIGTVNNAVVTIGNRNYAAGELLFSGFSHQPTSDGIGRTFEVEYAFLGVGGHSWNQVLDREGQWRTVNTKTDLSGQYPFQLTAYWANLP